MISLANIANITFDPEPNYNGNVTFTYQARDGAAYSPDATITVSV